MKELRTIQFRVFPSPKTNDCDVRIFIDGEDFIQNHWPDMMGMDPDDILSYDVLAPSDSPHNAVLIRCGCGVAGCGHVTARIYQDDDHVIWDSWSGDEGNPPPESLIFEKNHYIQAVKDAVNDHGWETPDRTAARLLKGIVDREVLSAKGLSFQWASGRIKKDTFTVSLGYSRELHQTLVHTAWGDESAEQMAQRVATLLKEHPSQWPNVEWFGRSETPPFDGLGWRK